MKNINVTFEDKEFEKVEKLKGIYSWREFILNLVDDYDKKQ